MITLRKIWKRILAHKIIAFGALSLIIVGGYGLLSWQFWKNYQSSYESAYTQLHSDIDHALELPSASTEEKTQKISTLHQVTQLPNDTCDASFLTQWQTVIETLRASQERCKQLAAESQALADQLGVVTEYLKNEQSLHTLLVSVSSPGKIEADAFENQAKEWQILAKDVAELQVQSNFKPVKNKASESMAVISNAWQRLHETNKSEDRGAYEDARAKLSEAYDTLAAIDPASKKQLQALTQSLQGAYDTLF